MKDAVSQKRVHTGLELELLIQHLPPMHMTLSSGASLINQTPALSFSLSTMLLFSVWGTRELPLCLSVSTLDNLGLWMCQVENFGEFLAHPTLSLR